MIMKLLLIAFVAAIVFWGVGRFLPRARAFFKTRLLPLILSPMALPILKRAFWLLLLRIIVQEEGNHRPRIRNQFCRIQAFVKMIGHVVHLTVMS